MISKGRWNSARGCIEAVDPTGQGCSIRRVACLPVPCPHALAVLSVRASFALCQQVSNILVSGPLYTFKHTGAQRTFVYMACL